MKDSFNIYGVKMYYFNDTENWVSKNLKFNIKYCNKMIISRVYNIHIKYIYQ